MNKIQKFFLTAVAVCIGLSAVAVIHASTAANRFVGTVNTVSNNWTLIQTNIFAGSSSNFGGVATMYIATNTTIVTNSVQLLPFNDQYTHIRVINWGNVAIVVDPINPLIGTNGYVIAGSGGSLTFPTQAGDAVPAVLFAAPTNSASTTFATNVYTSGWLSPTGN